MSNIKKLMMSAAGGDTLDVDDVFSTYVYKGLSNGSITNGIDLSNEGGMVWFKHRDSSTQNALYDTERGVHKYLECPFTRGEQNDVGVGLTSFNSDGFGFGGSSTNSNGTNERYVSWTFRKAPKFFDVVTFTGTGSASTNIPHNLGVAPAMIIIKRTNSTSDWGVWHRGTGVVGGPGVGAGDFTGLSLNATTASAQQAPNSYQYFTDTYFKPTYVYDDSNATMNVNGGTYVAYLFAHNDGDGGFGPNSDADIIKCGSYVSNESTPPEITLGFEPQWILIKKATGVDEWAIFDNMRGVATGGKDSMLRANLTSAEYSAADQIDFTSTGFKLTTAGLGVTNAPTGETYIYMAIRRGTKVPESGTEVFAIDTGAGTGAPMFGSGFPVDFAMGALPYTSAHDKRLSARLTGIGYGNVEASPWYTDSNMKWDHMEGYYTVASDQPDWISWMWKRAPGFFDVVTYEWNGVGTRDVEHNLGVAPEMYIVKRRNFGYGWYVRHKDFFGTNSSIVLNSNAAKATTGLFTTAATTDTTFPVANDATVNASGGTYIAYLFATLDGISKVGSYTGNGSSQTIDCGFSSGARFILIKRTDSTGDWYLWDTERGIVTGNDPYLTLNTSSAQVTSTDWVDPDSSGFIVNGTTINASSAEYIFYAIA